MEYRDNRNIELDAHGCQTFYHFSICLVKVQKRVDFLNRTNRIKTSLNVAELQV